jgi:formylglycine-generating enzyme required for sulfatase activity
MCGNTWEWTESERSDGRTRFAMIRGGSYYEAKGSPWYMDGGPQPCNFAAKVLLMWPGLDRCATVGFRCAADAG